MSVRPGETVLDAVARWRPEVVIIGEQPDLRRRWAEMLDVWPPVRVVQLVDTAGSDLVRAARDAGCAGVVERSGDLIELASAIEQVAEDGLVFPKTTRQKTETPVVNPLS